MTAFAYTAIPLKRNTSEIVSGQREAADERTLREGLRQEGLIAIEVRPVRLIDVLRGTGRGGKGGAAGLKRADSVWFFQTMALLLVSKVPIESAMTTMVDLAPTPAAREACSAVRESLRGGESLANAIAARPGLATAQHVALLKSGQESGRLDHAAVLIDRSITASQKLRRSVVGRLIYPAILLLATVLALWFLATYVLPKFADTLDQLGGQLPLPTAITLAIASVVVWLVPCLVVLVGVAILTRHSWLSGTNRAKLSRMALTAPVIGPLVWNSQSAVLTDMMATMLEGGSDLLSALRSSHEVVSNHAIAERLSKATKSVREGTDLAEALRANAVLPPVVLALVQAGSKSGEVVAALRRATEVSLEAQERITARLLTLMEPAITLVMAGAVGWVVYSLVAGMMAMTDIAGS